MDFASDYAYWNENEEADEVDEAELEGDLVSNLSRSSASPAKRIPKLSKRKRCSRSPPRSKPGKLRRSRSRSRSRSRRRSSNSKRKSRSRSRTRSKPSALSSLTSTISNFFSPSSASPSSASSSSSSSSESIVTDSKKAKDTEKQSEKQDKGPQLHGGLPPLAPLPAKKVIRRQADTNVVAVKFGALATDADEIFSGDATFCKTCKAVLSAISTLSLPDKEGKDKDLALEEGDQVWRCEFCGTANAVNLELDEVPKKDSRDYVLEPAPVSDKKQDDGKGSTGACIFCLDTSGSMCVTAQVPGKIKIKGKRAEPDIPEELREFVPPRGGGSSTWVSRLQCVQSSVDTQMEQWSTTEPDKKVGLVTFGREVTILGDGTTEPETVAGDKLGNHKVCEEIGNKHVLAKGLKDTRKSLEEKLWALEEKGPTALGPALLMSVSMASKIPASTVVVCTDGIANVGLGSLEGIDDDTVKQGVEQWYEGVANVAKVKGVTINVISIKGQECALEDLGKVAEITGGQVERVDPATIARDVKDMLKKPTISTQVSATFMIHRGLKFRNEDASTNVLRREVGNVTEDSEITFEYEKQEAAKLSEYKDLKGLPFQLQIHFTKLDGMKCLRVISKLQPITTERTVAEKEVKADLIAANVAQQSAKFAEKGQYVEARANNLAWGRLLQRHGNKKKENEEVYNHWKSDMMDFDRGLQQQQMRLEDVEAKESLSVPASSLRGKPLAKKSKSRQAKSIRTDDDYTQISKFKQKSASSYHS